MEMQFNKQYAFTDLTDGDRFYFLGDRKKTVYEYKTQIDAPGAPKIKASHETHWQLPTYKQKTGQIIFLRHAGTK